MLHRLAAVSAAYLNYRFTQDTGRFDSYAGKKRTRASVKTPSSRREGKVIRWQASARGEWAISLLLFA
eukprot:2543217-Pyramimonas_sp.AAC.1